MGVNFADDLENISHTFLLQVEVSISNGTRRFKKEGDATESL